jgi:secreted trypsin-like serine protease
MKLHGGWVATCAVILLVLMPALAAAQRADVPAERIVGGTAPTRAWPAQGYLEIVQPSGVAKVCGGTLVSGRWFLTAGHCASTGASSPPAGVQLAAGAFTVNLGESDVTQFSGPERFAVDDVQRDPLFDRRAGTANHDLALLHLATATPATTRFEPMRVVSAGESALWAPGIVGTVIGWGASAFGGPRPTQLAQAGVPILADGACSAAYPLSDPNPFDFTTMFCAGDGSADTCTGDSGGPIMVPRVDTFALAGVTSYGFECANASKPGIYARVGSTAMNAWVRGKIPTTEISIRPGRPMVGDNVALLATAETPDSQPGLPSFAWDLDDDGHYDDDTGPSAMLRSIRAGSTVVRVQVSYPDGDRAIAREVVTTVGSPLPQPPPPPPPPPKPVAAGATAAASAATVPAPAHPSSVALPAIARLLAGPKSVRVRSLLDGRMTIAIRCSVACTLKARYTLDGRTARRLGLTRFGAAVLIGTGKTTIRPAGASIKLTIRLSRKAVRALRRAQSGATRVRVTATSGSRTQKLERTITLHT